VFDVVPWLVTLPSSIASGIVADRLIASGLLTLSMVYYLNLYINIVYVYVCLLIIGLYIMPTVVVIAYNLSAVKPKSSIISTVVTC
jgi:hypothetical protein